MIADIVAAKAGEHADLDGLPIRPVNLGSTDDRPGILYESKGISPDLGLNCVTGNKSGTVVFYILADTYNECMELTESLIDAIHGQTAANAYYNVGYIKVDEEEDISQEIDERKKPFYVKAIDVIVRAEKL